MKTGVSAGPKQGLSKSQFDHFRVCRLGSRSSPVRSGAAEQRKSNRGTDSRTNLQLTFRETWNRMRRRLLRGYPREAAATPERRDEIVSSVRMQARSDNRFPSRSAADSTFLASMVFVPTTTLTQSHVTRTLYLLSSHSILILHCSPLPMLCYAMLLRCCW